MKNKNISFDFDGTLNDYFDGTPNPKKYEIRKVLLSLSKDNTIFITTRRFGTKFNEASIVYDLAEELGVAKENINFVDRAMKIDPIRRNNIYLHFDDDQYELSVLKSYCKVVNVESPNWKGEIPND